MHPASISPDPRRQAAVILARVEGRGAHAARLLAEAPPFVRELVLGTLRWQGTVDTLLAPHLHTSIECLDAEVRSVLRLGVYEAKRLDTPVPVAVAEAVRVAKLLLPRAAGLVNAVLRRAAGESWPDPGDPSVPAERRLSHPAWLVARWRKLFGEARLEATLLADQQPAPMTVLAAASNREELERSGCVLVAHPVVPGVLVVAEGSERVVRALREGRAYAMDPTAVLVARLLPVGRGVVADLAAAPGGKSLVLAWEGGGARRLAADRNIGRVAMMRRTLGRTPEPPWVAAADAARPPLRPGSCSGVLLDAPCSGTGTLRRHPEIRWRLRAADLAGLAELQRRLAASAADLLAPGGHLLYATCSLEPEENGEVIASLGLESVPLAGALPAGTPAVELPSGGVAILPGATSDGFTVHLLRRPVDDRSARRLPAGMDRPK
ncbi:MAG: RsmB/NOP family class I SAM-dependent RNA methyltransferase [Acidobacteriota bacterium]